MLDFTRARVVHFIGIGGIGTSAIARMFLLEGKEVSGSDMAESEVTLELRKAGVRIFLEENPKNVPKECDLVIYTIAIPNNHPELVEAKKRGIPILSYPEALGIISKDKYTIAITGTHGKTTTTAMVAKVLMDAGLDPTVIIGSFLLDVKSPLIKGALPSPASAEAASAGRSAGGVVPPNKGGAPILIGAGGVTPSGLEDSATSLIREDTTPAPHFSEKAGGTPFIKGDEAIRRTNFVAGKSKYLVVEGCEYCRSFLTLSPHILVITNIDADHLDYYRDMEDIISAFVELSQKLPKDGYLIIDSHAPNVQAVVKNSHAQNGDFAALKLPEGFRLHIPGAHNLLNAKAAWAVAKVLGIPDEQGLKSLSEFCGTWRRFEYRGKAQNDALVYDDYGHHPTEITATLSGTRELFPLNSHHPASGTPPQPPRLADSALPFRKGGEGGEGAASPKIVVVFQPHLYSRTKQHLQGFGAAFKGAASIILLPIYPAREPDPGDINSQMVVDELTKNGKDAHLAQTFAEAAALAEKLSGSGDLILTLGAGETNKVADLLVAR